MEPIRTVSHNSWEIRLDLSRQVLGLDIPEDDDDVWPRRRKPQERAVLATLPATPGFVPAAILMMKAKQFDDGLYAAVELAAQNGMGRFAGKASLLAALAERLIRSGSGEPSAAVVALLAACTLGGLSVPSAVEKQAAVMAAVARFLDQGQNSKPMGFYTWTSELEKIFRQDRLLQTSFPDPGWIKSLDRNQEAETRLRTAAEVAAREWSQVCNLLEQDACLRDTYATYLDFIARLTNPLRENDLRSFVAGSTGRQPPDPDEGWAFFPPSRSRESDLFERLYRGRSIPDGFDLMKELIRQIRAGAITSRPTGQSGWYDYQTWSLEPLLLPDQTSEAKHLQLHQHYRRHLVELFKGTLALARETHVKQGGGGRGGYGGIQRETVWVRPELTVEPLATCYLRRALGYRFIRTVLEDFFGQEALARMHRLSPDGPSRANLADELVNIESLFEGAHLTVSRQLGLVPQGDPVVGFGSAPESAITAFGQWSCQLNADADLAQDARMMVPIFYDEERRKTKVWTFLGWTKGTLDVSFVTPPRVLSCERQKKSNVAGSAQALGQETAGAADQLPLVSFTSTSHELFMPVFAEVYVQRLLDRDEFRKHCDRHRTREAILANLH